MNTFAQPAAGVPPGRCGEGQRGVDLGEGGPDGRGLAVCLAEQLACLRGGFLAAAVEHIPVSALAGLAGDGPAGAFTDGARR